MYHPFDAWNVQYDDDFKSMIKEDKYLDKTKKSFHTKVGKWKKITWKVSLTWPTTYITLASKN